MLLWPILDLELRTTRASAAAAAAGEAGLCVLLLSAESSGGDVLPDRVGSTPLRLVLCTAQVTAAMAAALMSHDQHPRLAESV